MKYVSSMELLERDNRRLRQYIVALLLIVVAFAVKYFLVMG